MVSPRPGCLLRGANTQGLPRLPGLPSFFWSRSVSILSIPRGMPLDREGHKCPSAGSPAARGSRCDDLPWEAGPPLDAFVSDVDICGVEHAGERKCSSGSALPFEHPAAKGPGGGKNSALSCPVLLLTTDARTWLKS